MKILMIEDEPESDAKPICSGFIHTLSGSAMTLVTMCKNFDQSSIFGRITDIVISYHAFHGLII